LPEGALLREWRLEEVLGVGGFGIVYRGRGLYFDELVAIKEYFPSAISDRRDDTTVAPNDSTSEEIYALGLQKFLEEAKVLWNLSKPDRHPNIVSVRSLFEINGTAYMVMDFEVGLSLSRMLKAGRRFDEASLLAIIRPIAEGLDRAHRAGVLHRDIKPANILVDDTGRSVLIDFGSARFDAGQATSTKVTFYTPPYAAIEQYVKTYPQGPWTDIYALGVTLYECVTGEKPPEVLERLHGGLGQSLSSREWSGFSATFTKAVDAAMAPKPSDRPQTIGQWLRMFDADVAPTDDEATRIAVTPSPPSPPADRSGGLATDHDRPLHAGPSELKAASSEALAKDGPGHKRRGPLIIAVAVGMLLVGGAGVMIMASRGLGARPPRSAPPTVAAQSAQGPAASAPAVAAPMAPPPLATEVSALAADADKAGRPRKETAALKAAADRLADLDAKFRALAGRPDAAATSASLIADMNRRAGDAAAGETASLSRDADALLKPVLHNPGWGLSGASSGSGASSAGADQIDTVRKARAAMRSALGAFGQAKDGEAKVAAAHSELTAFQTLSADFALARPAFTEAERRKYQAMDAAARQTFAEIARAASGPKPWIFAGRAEKDAYKLSQDNAAKARARIGELDALFQRVRGSEDLEVLNAAALQVTSIQADLNRLKSAMPAPQRKSGAQGASSGGAQ